MTDRPRHLFVYGTLLAEAQHPMGARLAQYGSYLGRGFIAARLYIIEEIDDQGPNSYPGAVPSPHPEDRVYGAVYEIHDPKPLFEAFDAFEACAPGWPEPYEFELRPIDVVMEAGETLRAGSYLYTWDTSRATLVPSGRYERISPDVR